MFLCDAIDAMPKSLSESLNVSASIDHKSAKLFVKSVLEWITDAHEWINSDTRCDIQQYFSSISVAFNVAEVC